MLLPPEGVSELRHCCRPDSNRATSACAVLYRSNRHLHHRLANAHCCAWQSKEYAGERATSAFNDPNASSSLRKNRARDAAALARPLPRYVTSKAGFEPAFPGTKYSKSSPPVFAAQRRRLAGEASNAKPGYGPVRAASPGKPASAVRGKPNCKTNIVVALSNMARHRANPIGSPCHRWTAIARAVPSGRPRAFGRARSLARAPGSGSPVFHFDEQTLLRRTKNPPERRLGRVRETRTFDIAYARSLP